MGFWNMLVSAPIPIATSPPISRMAGTATIDAREKLPVENQGSGASMNSGVDIARSVACCPLPRYT